MALRAYLTADEHGKLDDARRKDYIADGEGFRLDVEATNGLRLENVDALVSGKARLKQDYDALRDKYKSYDGLDVEKAREALEKVKNLGDSDTKASEKIEAVRRQLLEEREAEKQGYVAQVQAIESQLQRHLIEAAASQALAKHKGDAALLMPHIASAVKATKNDKGQYGIQVVGPEGTPIGSRLSGHADKDMDVDEYVSSILRQRFPTAFEGSGHAGTGAPGSGARGGMGPGRFTLTRDQARDPQTYQAVKEAASAAKQQVSIVE